MFELTNKGFIYGASASFEGLNVTRRLKRLNLFHQISGDSFADIGCGHGAFASQLIPKCRKKFFFLDIKEENINRCRERFGGGDVGIELGFMTSYAEHIDLPSSSFDNVFMIEVLDHVDDVGSVIKEAFRLLEPGGKFYFTVPNRMFLFETHPIRIKNNFYSPRFFPFLPWLSKLHSRLATAAVFSMSEMQLYISNAGFSELKAGYMMPPLEKLGYLSVGNFLEKLEQTPVGVFGVSICGVAIK